MVLLVEDQLLSKKTIQTMKTKILLIALAAVTLLSFTLISSSRSSHKVATTQQETKTNHSGFAMQDANQF